MIICPNCNHQNPGGAVQCEACYTPLPSMLDCPTCSAPVQSDASFCGQCGANLAGTPIVEADPHRMSTPNSHLTSRSSDFLDIETDSEHSNIGDPLEPHPEFSASSDIPDLNLPDVQIPELNSPLGTIEPEPSSASPSELSNSPDHPSSVTESFISGLPETERPTPPSSAPFFKSTQLQTHLIQLIHTHTNTALDIPQHLTTIHIGKPNDRVSPDIDVSGFQDSEVVSRVHADIRIEGDAYYLEDMGSSNGTYVNNVPLLRGNRHRLRSGDRIALGKGDKVSFIVQITSA